MNKVRWFFVLSLVLLSLSSATATAAELRIAVASSLADIVVARCAEFTKRTPGVSCVINKGGSGILARQIEQGAPVDLFVSAHPAWVEFLASKGLLVPDSVVSLAGNRLVFVGAPGSVGSIRDLLRLNRVALGNPASVPAGKYAEEALRRSDIYEPLSRQGRLVFSQDVRQALAYAERGEVDGAFVYRSDAQLAKKVVVLFEVSAELHSPIVAPMALTMSGFGNDAARGFWKFLLAPESVEAFVAAGFTRP